jgi:glycyl-tRNA synthetase beta chain
MSPRPASDTQPLLVEIGTEELPPKSLPRLAHAFLENFETLALSENLLPPGAKNQVYFSPRRLAIYAPALRLKQPDREEERLGPAFAAAFDAAGNPTKAAEGFAASCGVGVQKLERRQTDKGERLAYTIHVSGDSAAEVLPDILREALAKLPVAKRMRWGAGTVEFVRPVHWLLLLLGEQVLKTELLGVKAGNKTYGHRFHHPAAITVKRPADYRRLLEKTGKVLVEDREGSLAARVGALVTQAAKRLGGLAQLDPALLQEVAALVEWPVAVTGGFDARFLSLPDEVIVAVLQGQQRYFPLRDQDGRLLSHFVTISNIQSLKPKEVQQGNERVIVPRLTDAMFFWERDRRARLEARLPELDKMIFQKELGSYGDKRRRVSNLAEAVAGHTGGDPLLARRAATLAKCDLLSDLVGEFPELQGSIGRRIAAANGEDPEVAAAIEEHYLPRFGGDRLPQTSTGRTLAIADKLDTLTGIFAIGQKPTGEKDPFALRRAGLGIVRIAVEGKVEVRWSLLRDAVAELGQQKNLALAGEVEKFLIDRLRAYCLEAGQRADIFEAVASVPCRGPLDLHRRLAAVAAFMDTPAARNLAAANKRIANILRQADQKKEDYSGRIDASAYAEPPEQALHTAITRLSDEVTELSQHRLDYPAALARLASLRESVDAFFEKTLVMAEDPAVRRRRLALLAALYALFKQIADFSLIQTA